ncbi:hypothetical protein ACUN0C_15425 [Faunimonas sp. B44]|uniref:hypothetical protein n=1 Tax=Faunimonas sp. B44 TaxID=3461493 RepID=UPI0040443723
MRALTGLAAVALVLGTSAAHADFLGDLFRYEPRVEPRAGDCAALAAAIGPGAVWYGRYAGKYLNTANDRHRAYSAEGCFASEAACRVWQQRSITYALGPIVVTSCRPGLPGRYR